MKQKKPSKLSAFFICVLVATLLWFLHSLNTVYTKQFSIPVEFKNYPQNKLMIEIPKDIKVSVKASGLKLFMIGLTEPFPVLRVDLNDVKSDASRSKYYLSSNIAEIKKMFQFKADIRRIQPDTISFINNEGTQKEVPVKVPLSINYTKGYTAKLITVDPARVIITGEVADLEGIDTIYTLPVSLNDQRTDLVKTLTLINPNNKIALNSSVVQLAISLGKLVEKEVSIPIKLENADEHFKYSLFPSKVKVKYSGVFGESGADTSLLRVFVDLSQRRSNKLSVNVKLLSEHITVLSFEPKEVEFLMIKK
ncbi:MAG: YbbR-like domain-containing protein [Sphingobacteriaceae bacterium]|nr:YbbR-like domain-containing protein [Sphingobacteriaceae bacterium]